MRLKKLVTQGYKTFASKTEFIFDDGITAVVGPNGSGKSNVADAVRWVLGEQSFSTLRGKKTTDMIFSGSKTRARAGMASAILTLDNSDGWLPIDYSEVEICRRAYRTGENEYLLNGQKVRLKDISELLAKAGLAEQTYTIIGQGLIDKALSLKSDERRALFEEAAGISHYKSRRSTTLRKLQDTQRNLQRVHDILSELKPRLSSLKRQANRAQNYNQVQTDLRDMLRIWYGFQWEKSKVDIRNRRSEAESVEKRWIAERNKLLDQQEEIDKLRQTGRSLEESVQELEQRRELLREQLESTRRDVAILTERRTSLERQLNETKEDMPLLTSQKEAADVELNLAMTELESIQNELKVEQAELATFEKSFETRQAEINKATAEVRRLEKTEREIQNRLAQRQGQVAQLEERLKEQEKPITGLEDLDQLLKEEEKLTKLFESAQSSANDLRDQRSGLRDEERELEKSIKAQRRKVDEARRATNKATTEMARLQAKVEMLEQNRQAEIPLDGIDVVGRLAEFLTIPDEHNAVIGRSLESTLNTLILGDDTALNRLLALPHDGFAAIVNGLPTSNGVHVQRFDGRAGCIGWANQLVTAKPEGKAICDHLLGHTLIVKSNEVALALQAELPAGCAAASMDGIIVHANGLVERPRADAAISVIARENAFRDAVQALENKEDEFNEIDNRLADEQKALRNLNQELEEKSRDRRRLGGIFAEAEQRANRAQRDIEKVSQRKRFLEQQRSGRETEINRLRERLEKGTENIAADEAEIITITSNLAEAREKLESLPVGEVKQQRESLQQQISSKRAILDGRRAIVDSRRSTLNQLDKQIIRLDTRRKEWSGQLLKLNLTDSAKSLDKLEKEMVELDGELKPIREQQRNIVRQRREQENDLAPVQKLVHTLETQFTQTKIALTQKETQIENLKERIKAELGIVSLKYDDDQVGDTPLPIEEVVEELPQIDEIPEGMEGQIQKLRSQLSRMGAVNPDAPAEYETVRERHDFMETQIEDLNQTEAHLRQVIDELDELTSKAFAETVVKVNAVFGKMFTRLFGGGSAELELTDPDDLTVSGVDIIAQLPGRRPQGLALLSGGERSLTAASLIFALLKVSPTPFCVMDEVDAALDEANVNRFREVLMELSDETQFIVITHNRGTVQAARAIYGITMGTDSTSQVISIKPEEYLTQPKLINA